MRKFLILHISQFFLNRIFRFTHICILRLLRLVVAWNRACFRLRFHHPLHFFVCLLSYLTMLSTTRDLALATLLLFNSFFPPRRYLCVCCCCFFSVFSRLLNLSKHFLFLGFTTLLFSFSFAGLFALQYNNCTFFCLFVLYSFLIKNQFHCF